MSDWSTYTLGELCDKITDGAHQSPRSVELGLPMASVKDLTPYGVDVRNARHISAEDFRVLVQQGCQPEIGDVLIAKDGNSALDTTCTVRSVPNYVLLSSVAILRPNKKKLNSSYLMFLLRNRDYISYLKNNYISGAAIPRVVLKDFRRAELTIPSLATQETIADVLSALENKIELNLRMNETLEGIAQAIFKDWFVDFGPVRRKLAGATDPVAIMGGLAPARAAELAALFPDGFGDDGLPDGWVNQEIGSLVGVAGGSTPSTSDSALWEPAQHWWATPKDLSSMSDLALFSTERRISNAGLSRITSGVLPVGTVLLSSRAPIGYLAISQIPVSINQGFIALKPDDVFGSAYLYLWCKSNMDQIVANANGSTFQEISKKNFRPIKSALPLKGSIVQEFCNLSQPLIDRIVVAAAETRTLAETRDYLLPKLMSGELRVRDSEKIAG